MFDSLSVEMFKERTEINPFDFVKGWKGAEKIVSLRELDKVIGVQLMEVDYLRQLLSSVTLKGSGSLKPYKDCKIKPFRIDPRNVKIGQTFVQRDKYRGFIEEFPTVFEDFCMTPGLVNYNPSIVLGKKGDELVIAHYLPPIIEQQNNHYNLLDGIHRNFIAKNTGTTTEAILVKGVEFPFPCNTKEWNEVKVVDQKPDKSNRFFDLDRKLFRDLKSIGIDG